MDGVVPLSKTFDSIGPMAKSPLDLANILDVIIDPAQSIAANGGYASNLQKTWKGLRIGWLDPENWFFSAQVATPNSEAHEQIVRLNRPSE